MLQRAASNAYSWWWASHIRTKQSKWLEQSLQDMEEKVQSTLKLIEEDGDSFAKRAEMYYKKRPELIFFVQESYRAYRALAERYDHISTELQNANNTLATVFPEQVQFAMDDEDDYGSPRVPPKIVSQAPPNNVPKVPKYPTRDLKGLLTSASNKLQAKKSSKAANASKTALKSGLSKPEALEEIDKLQKEILALQTVKEFVKSSYESGLSKHREIEKQIAQVQERVFSLQDEFRVGKVIEDDEARTLMAEAALKSCEESLAQLQEKQEKSTKEARAEQQRIEDAHEKLKSFKHKFLPDLHADEEKTNYKDESAKAREKPQSLNSEAGGVIQERQEREASKEKIMAHFEVNSKEPLTVTELAEKIDELVSKVISLETAVSSQTALIDRLRTETDELHIQIWTLEDDKATLIDGTNTLTNRLRGMEEKWKGLQDLNQNVENQNNHLQRHFIEARHGLDQLSHKLHNVKPDEELESVEPLQEEEKPSVGVKMPAVLEKREDMPSPGDGSMNSRGLKAAVVGEDKNEQVLSNNQGEKEEQKVSWRLLNNDGYTIISGKRDYTKSLDKVDKHGVSQTADNIVNTTVPQEVVIEKDDEPNWQKMLLNGLEDREKILLTEYIAILRNYKDVKKKLSDAEKKNRDSLFETTVQLREKSSTIAKRDEEILSLRQKLNLLQGSFSEDKDLKEANRPISVPLENQNAKPDAAEVNADLEIHLAKKEEDGVKLILMDQQPQSISPTEEKLRMSIDALLDENLDFWLRFSTSFHQVQKFKTGVQDLQAEIAKLEEKEKLNQEGSAAATTDIKSDVRPLYKHLREIQTELTVWIEKSAVLKEELQRRFSSLCNIQEEISRALKAGAEEEEMKFTSHEAAKFQGEVLNMKQENKKVGDELQAGLDHVTALQQEIEKTLAKLNNEFGLSRSGNNNQPQLRNSMSRSRVPLRSFIFGTKPKKKSSIFSCMHHRKYQDLRAGLPM